MYYVAIPTSLITVDLQRRLRLRAMREQQQMQTHAAAATSTHLQQLCSRLLGGGRCSAAAQALSQRARDALAAVSGKAGARPHPGSRGSGAARSLLQAANPPPDPPPLPPPQPPPPSPPPPRGILSWAGPGEIQAVVHGDDGARLQRYATACGSVQPRGGLQNRYNLTIGSSLGRSWECVTTEGTPSGQQVRAVRHVLPSMCALGKSKC